MTEIDLRRQEGRRGHAHAPFLCQPGQRRGKQGAADAVAHGVDLQLAGGPFDGVHRCQRSLLHVVFEGLAAGIPIGIDPGNHEYGKALIDAPLDEGLFRLEVENVEFVDPWRHDQ